MTVFCVINCNRNLNSQMVDFYPIGVYIQPLDSLIKGNQLTGRNKTGTATTSQKPRKKVSKEASKKASKKTTPTKKNTSKKPEPKEHHRSAKRSKSPNRNNSKGGPRSEESLKEDMAYRREHNIAQRKKEVRDKISATKNLQILDMCDGELSNIYNRLVGEVNGRGYLLQEEVNLYNTLLAVLKDKKEICNLRLKKVLPDLKAMEVIPEGGLDPLSDMISLFKKANNERLNK